MLIEKILIKEQRKLKMLVIQSDLRYENFMKDKAYLKKGIKAFATSPRGVMLSFFAGAILKTPSYNLLTSSRLLLKFLR